MGKSMGKSEISVSLAPSRHPPHTRHPRRRLPDAHRRLRRCRAHSPEAPGDRPQDLRSSLRTRAGRVRPGGRRRIGARRDLDRDGIRSLDGARGPRAAHERRDPQPGRLDALLGVVRCAAAVLPRRGPPAERSRPREHRGASPFRWERYVGLEGAIIGVNHFGASAPGPTVMREFGFTPEHIVETAKVVLQHTTSS